MKYIERIDEIIKNVNKNLIDLSIKRKKDPLHHKYPLNF